MCFIIELSHVFRRYLLIIDILMLFSLNGKLKFKKMINVIYECHNP